MSKSEYKRLAVQIPDVVKTIREQVLDEAIEAVNSIESNKPFNGYNTAEGYDSARIEAIKAIEKLKVST